MLRTAYSTVNKNPPRRWFPACAGWLHDVEIYEYQLGSMVLAFILRVTESPAVSATATMGFYVNAEWKWEIVMKARLNCWKQCLNTVICSVAGRSIVRRRTSGMRTLLSIAASNLCPFPGTVADSRRLCILGLILRRMNLTLVYRCSTSTIQALPVAA